MVTNYYNAGNRFSAPVRREPKPYVAPSQICDICGGVKIPECETETETAKREDAIQDTNNKTNSLCASGHKSSHTKRQETDPDALLLVGLVLLLLTSGCKDKWLLLALGYLLLF